MNKQRLLPLISVCFSLGAALLAAILRTCALLTAFDPQIGFFDPSALVTVETVLCFLAVILPTVCACLIPKDTLPAELPDKSRDLTALLPLAGFLAFVLTCTTNRAAFLGVKLNPAGKDTVLSGVVTALTVLAVVGVVYAFCLLYGVKSRPLCAGIGLVPIFWCLVLVSVTYLDQYVAMNSPLKIGLQMGTLAMAVALTAELRVLLGRTAPRCYLVFMGIGAFFCFDNGVSYLIASLAHAVKEKPLYEFAAYVLAAMGLYFALRLVQYLRLHLSEKEEPASCA
ncbi:MAG: hypothetical protein MJ192_01920 [Clostridia bacterium]|nr:hypothetical protein [Clostridia bacterium]